MLNADSDNILSQSLSSALLNGPDATRKIRELGFEGAIFGVTGNVLAEDVAVFTDHGADDVVAKPVKFAKIAECWTSYDKKRHRRKSTSVYRV